jgi:hypothetical protein
MKRLVILLSFMLCSAAHAANILISNAACVGVAATPAPDVAYKAGVDVNGKAVVPAELPGSAPAITPPDTIKIPLQINLQNALHISNNSNLVAPEAVAGTVEYKNGQVTFNGQPVSSDAAAQIADACQNSKTPAPILGQHSKNLLMGQ